MTSTPSTLNGVDMVAQACRIAAERHAGQLDAAGAPYNGHLTRVVARAEALRSTVAPHQSPYVVQAVAWLHDVIEDTDVTADDLIAAGIPHDVVDEVARLTHAPNEPRDQYLSRVTVSVVASLVKLADTLDNGNESRLAAVAAIDPPRAQRLTKKYEAARRVLQARLGMTSSL